MKRIEVPLKHSEYPLAQALKIGSKPAQNSNTKKGLTGTKKAATGTVTATTRAHVQSVKVKPLSSLHRAVPIPQWSTAPPVAHQKTIPEPTGPSSKPQVLHPNKPQKRLGINQLVPPTIKSRPQARKITFPSKSVPPSTKLPESYQISFCHTQYLTQLSS